MKLSEKFIKAGHMMCDFDNRVNAPYLRKNFTLDFAPEKAEITVCGLGFYELYINGKDITKGPLAPYISNPEDICYYDNYDISALLNKGDNVIGLLLGNGMRNAFGGFIWDFDKAPHRGPVAAALCLEAEGDGKSFELEADESFLTYPSPITFDDLRMGCHYDARLETNGWNMVGFDDSGWKHAISERTPAGIKKLCGAEPIAVRTKLTPVSIRHYDKLCFAYSSLYEPIERTLRHDIYVYDFGVNTAGITQLRINGTPGQKITIRHGETTINGDFTVNGTIFLGHGEQHDNNYLDYGQTDVFICKGGEEVFTPRFKYDGFRYAYVEGLKPDQAVPEALTFIVMNSDIKERGGFDCSDPTLNRLQEITRRSDLSNFYYFPTDCPHREKNGWTADAWQSSEHMLLNLTVERSLEEWLANIRMAQTAEGALPGIIPTGGWGFEWGNGPVWDAVCVNLPYYIYKYTGNKQVIKDNAAMIMRYLVYICTKRNEKGLVAIGLGDWLDPFQGENNGQIHSPLEFTDSTTVYDIAKKSAFLFSQAGLDKESVYATSIADDMRACIRTHLIDHKSMTVIGDCQTSQAYAIFTGIFDESELDAARKKLINIIHRDGDINACGLIGTRCIFHVLSDMDEAELAYKMITAKSFTGYSYWLDNDATSLWEKFAPANSNIVYSKNHHFLGDISGWFILAIAGLSPNPDCDDTSYYEIRPHFIPQLSHAHAFFESVCGRAEVMWRREEDGAWLNVTLPENTHAKIISPTGYTFEDGGICKEVTRDTTKRVLALRLLTQNIEQSAFGGHRR